MSTKKLTCVVCPKGCEIEVLQDSSEILNISGYGCPRGKLYATDECLFPKRTLTTTVLAEGFTTPVISVRSNQPIPKELLSSCISVLRTTTVREPFEVGRIIVQNILDTGADIILTNC